MDATGCPAFRSASFSGLILTHTVTLLLELPLADGFFGLAVVDMFANIGTNCKLNNSFEFYF